MFKPFSVFTIAGLALALSAPGALAQPRGATKKAPPVPVTAPAPAPASSGGIGEGDTELNFFGTLSDSDAGVTSILLGVAFGKYISNNLELKLTQSVFMFDAGVATAFFYTPFGSAEYQIRPNPGSPFVAYVGGGAGMNLGSIDAGGTDIFIYNLFLTPVGGFKYFLNERTSLTYALSYQFTLLGGRVTTSTATTANSTPC